MRIQLKQEELTRLSPAEPGLGAHCRRVATMAVEIARVLHAPARDLTTVEHAALLHHIPMPSTKASALDRLLVDVRNSASTEASGYRELPQDLKAALQAFHAFPAHRENARAQLWGHVIALANLLDEQIEANALQPGACGSPWTSAEALRGLFHLEVWAAARQVFPGSLGVPREHWDLPVQANVARELINLMSGTGVSEISALAKIAHRDPVISGRLIQAANSPLFGIHGAIRSVPHALSYLGTDTGRKILVGLVLRPLFASGGLRSLWQHSVMIAQFLENLARMKGFMDPDEAMLAGLIHDIGRIALLRHPQASRHVRLVELGCPPAHAEVLLFGADHAEVGANILEQWSFPASLVDAVRHHHRPADTESKLAAAIYVAEFWNADDEDLPSLRHLRSALERVECSLEDFGQFEGKSQALAALLKVA